MGLLHTATVENRIIDSGLTITYSKNVVYGNWKWWNLLNIEGTITKAWEYKRFARKTYRYVGMDYDSACAKAQQLRSSYTRDYYISETEVASSPNFIRVEGGQRIQTQISVEKVVGHIYQVVISVNEEDSAMKTTGNYLPEAVFALENTRTYDY